MIIGSRQDVMFIPDKNGRIYITCTPLKKGFYVIADQNGHVAIHEGFSKKGAIRDVLINLEKMNREKR